LAIVDRRRSRRVMERGSNPGRSGNRTARRKSRTLFERARSRRRSDREGTKPAGNRGPRQTLARERRSDEDQREDEEPYGAVEEADAVGLTR